MYFPLFIFFPSYLCVFSLVYLVEDEIIKKTFFRVLMVEKVARYLLRYYPLRRMDCVSLSVRRKIFSLIDMTNNILKTIYLKEKKWFRAYRPSLFLSCMKYANNGA